MGANIPADTQLLSEIKGCNRPRTQHPETVVFLKSYDKISCKQIKDLNLAHTNSTTYIKIRCCYEFYLVVLTVKFKIIILSEVQTITA